MKKITLICSLLVFSFALTKAQPVSTLAGSTTAGSNNGTGAGASFSLPIGVATDGTNLYVADATNNLIRQVNISTGVVTTLAGTGAPGNANGTGPSASFNAPHGIVYDGAGVLYVADYNNNQIRKIVIGGAIVSTLAGNGMQGTTDGPGTSAMFHNPTALTIDGAGNLFVADMGNTEIRQVVISNGVVTTLAGSTTSGSTDGIGAAAQFASPSGIVFANSLLYVTDMGNNEVRTVDPGTGQVTAVFGTTTAGSADGFGVNAGFNQPYGIAYDGNGNLYVADMGNNSIRKIFLTTSQVYTYAGIGGSGSTNGSTLNAKFNAPHGLITDATGDVFIADANNNEIREIGVCATAISASISGSGATKVCLGLNDTVIGIESGGVNAPYAFYWNGIASTDTLVANLISNTIYSLTVVDGIGCHSDTANTYVMVDDPGSFSIINDGPTICQGSGNSAFLQAMGGNASQFTWTPSNSISSGSPTLNNVNANPTVTTTYTVTGVDYQGCFAPSVTITVPVFSLPVVSITGNVLGGMSICSGIADTLTAVAVGNGPFTYSWNEGGTTYSPSMVTKSPSEYNVNVTDVNGCSSSADSSVHIGNNPALIVTGNSVVCSGSAANLQVSGAESYSWAPNGDFGDPTDSVQSVSPGGLITYTVTGNTGGCKSTQLVTINVASLPGVGISGPTTSCAGSSITLFGTGADVYQWTGGPNSAGYEVAPINNSSYTVTGTDLSTGCSNTFITTISVNPLPTITITGSASVCLGSVATLTANGADTYQWTGGPSTQTYNVSPQNTATFEVTGTSTVTGCSDTVTQVVVVDLLPSISIIGNSSVCNGSNVTLTANGADTYQWSGGPATAGYTFAPGAPATYTVTGTSTITACSNTATQTVQVYALPNVTISGDTTICNGSNTTLFASGADQYSWTGGPNTIGYNVSPSANATYTVVGVDLYSGCSNSATQLVTVNALPNVTITGVTSICNGSNTTLTGNGADTYQWMSPTGTGPATTAYTISPVSTSTYMVTGTSTLTTCSNSTLQTVTVNTLPNITISGNSTICNGSSTTLTATGADTYQWTGGPATASYSVSPVSSVSYMVTGTNTTTTCSNTASQVVSVNTPLPIVANAYPSSTLCQGGQVTLYGSGGSTYSWSSGVNDGIAFRPATSATYTVTSISGGCTVSSTVLVTVNPLPVIAITANPKDSICQGGNVTLTATGATSYSWNNGVNNAVAFSPATSNMYEVTGTDANGCVNSGQIPIVVNSLPAITGAVSPQTVCQGGSVTLRGYGGVSYTWSGGVTNGVAFIPVTSGTYTLTGTSAAGCNNTAVVGVTINPVPVISDSAIPSTSVCQGNSVALLGKGASSYSWSGGISDGISFVPTASGTYTVTGFGANGCNSKDSITIKVNNKVILNPLAISTTCALNNGSIKVTASSGTPPYIYSWSTVPVNTTDSIGSLSPGTYIITVNDVNKCSSYSSIDIASSTSPILSISTNSSSCGNASGSASVGVVGGTPPYRYAWSNGDTTNAANNLTLGTYIITVTDVNHCSSFASADISNLNGPSITANAVTNVACNSQATGAINIGVSGGALPYTFVWSNGATTQNISGLSAGPYQVTVTDGNNCSALGNFTITQPSALSFTKSIVKANCGVPDGGATITVSGGIQPYTYLWNNGRTSDSIASVNAGAYYVTIIDHNGCKIDSAQVGVSNVNGPVVSIGISGSASCGSGGVTLTANVVGGTIPYTYLWSTSSTKNSISQIPAGNYHIVVTDHLSCIGVADTSVYEVPPPVAPICMVTVDTSTKKNMVIWDKIVTQNIAHYNLYKESTQAGVYLKIASIPYNSNSVYVDTLSNPQIRSWRYELSQVDSCGNESALSPAHKTMHLTVNQGLANTINLIWDNYEGMSFSSYYVYRDTLSTSLTLIDSIPNNIFTYTDAHPPKAAHLYYQIQVVNPNPCNPHTHQPMTINYNASKSNTGNYTLSNTGIAGAASGPEQLSVFPNPSTGVFTLSLNTATGSKNLALSVVNTLGQVISTDHYTQVPAIFTKQLDLSTLAKGVYFIKMSTDNTTLYNKVVIQ